MARAAKPARPFSISPPLGRKSIAAWLALSPPTRLERLIDSLSANALLAAPWIFELWGRVDHQLEPPTDDDASPWSAWVVLGGRGSGKTRAGAEWVRAQVEGARPQDAGRARRVALVAETLDQARDVMVLGESGLLATSPPDRRPVFQPSRKRLLWPNGAEAHLYGASDPETLRGPQFDLAWSDELAKWRLADASWDMLQFGLRLGERPRQIVTTTPRANPTLLRILEDAGTVMTSAPTEANAAGLAPGFVEDMRRRYPGGAVARQELDGVFEVAPPSALWPAAIVDRARFRPRPEPERVVVAVDPPTTGHARSDACGIVVAGAAIGADPADWRAVVLEDASVREASPRAWAERAVDAYRRWEADRLVAEVNQGGDMVETILRQIDPTISFRAVPATRGKAVRAEPIAALYEQGRVAHAPGLDALESQMRRVQRARDGGLALRSSRDDPARSPDRVDALVWALHALMGPDALRAPRVRGL